MILKNNMRIYISGKIGEEELSSATIWKFRDAESALLDLRFAKFRDAESALLDLRFAPFNPCCDIWQRQLRKGYEAERKLLGSLALDYYTYVLREDINELSRYDAICLLPDWRQSKGARAELAFAQATGKKIYELNEYGTLIEWQEKE